MNLTCEELSPIESVSREQLDEILSSDVFGNYAILSQSDSDYIQAASDWQPTDECAAFIKANDSDPWIIEYRDGNTNAQYRADGYVTLASVMQAFASYLARENDWRTLFKWRTVEV